ncbi:hypothetical protein MBLNU459_g0368t1 [Dothideomycetes sp. NU459]
MLLELEEPLPSLVETRFVAAETAQALIFSATELSIINSASGAPFQLRYCPALAKKPKSNKTHETSVGGKKPDPFENPSSDLLIANIPRGDPSHVLVLNKYPVIPQHFILATKSNKEQTHMLEPDDLAATHACLRSWEDGGGGRLFAFFNSGDHSGASQAHRHIQFLPVDQMKRNGGGGADWKPLIEQMLDSPEDSSADDIRSGMKCIRSMPFTHFALPLPPNPSAELLDSTYKRLYRAAAAAVQSHIERHGDLELHPTEGGSSAISYNLALCGSGMAICPRRKEAAMLTDGDGSELGSVALNGTILAGTLMVKREEEWDLLRADSLQLDRVLETIGVPPTR